MVADHQHVQMLVDWCCGVNGRVGLVEDGSTFFQAGDLDDVGPRGAAAGRLRYGRREWWRPLKAFTVSSTKA